MNIIRDPFAGLCARNITVLCLLVCAVTFSGCKTIGKPPAGQAKAIQSGHKSIVLLQTTLAKPGNGATNNPGISCHYELARLNGSTPAAQYSSAVGYSPSKLADQQGWQYMLLEPGDYYFRQQLPSVQAQPQANPPFAFHVPANAPVIYIGSFGYEQRPLSSSGSNIRLGANTPRYQIRSLGLKDESAQAARIAGESLAEFGPVATSLATPYHDRPDAFAGIVTNHCITKVEAMKPAALKTDNVEVYAFSWVAAPLVVAGAALMTDSDDSDDSGVSAIKTPEETMEDAKNELIGAGLILAAIPVIIAADKLFGESEQKDWAPHQAALQKAFFEFELDRHLSASASNQLCIQCFSRTNPVPPAGLQAGTLQIEPYRVLLREKDNREFFLEVAVLVQLLDEASKTVLWQQDYTYTDHQIAASEAGSKLAFESLIPSKMPAHKLEEYKGEAGVKLFQNGLSSACDTLAEEVAARLKQAGFAYKKLPCPDEGLPTTKVLDNSGAQN